MPPIAQSVGVWNPLDDSPAAIRRIISLYREVLAGKRDGKSLWRELKASNQYGVTRGPLAVSA